jgi:hypothetical protein
MSALPAIRESEHTANELQLPAAADGPTEEYLSDELDGVIRLWLRAAIPMTGRGYKPRMRTPNR